MKREVELAKSAASGAFHLFFGKIISRVIGVLGGLMLIRLLKQEGYGLLNLALVAPGIFMLFSDFGINVAVTKYLAEHKSKGEVDKLKPLFSSSLVFKTTLSVMLTIMCFLLADAFAIVAIGKPYVAPLTRLASLLILVWMLYGFCEATFLGLDATRGYAVLMIVYEFFMAFLPILLVVFGMGVDGALIGMIIATIIAICFGITSSILIITKISKGADWNFFSKSNLKKMLFYGVPLAAATLIATGLTNFYLFMIAAYSNPLDIGNYGLANYMVSATFYLTFPVSTVLFPTFSKIDSSTEPEVLNKIFYYSVKYSSLIILPALALMIALAHPLTLLVFGESGDAWFYLTLLAIGELSYGLGARQLWKLLSAQGQTKLIAKLEAMSAAIAVSLSLILIPSYGILGLVAVRLVVGWPSLILALRESRKKFGIQTPLHDVWRLYIPLPIMIIALIPVVLAPIDNILKIIVSVLAGLSIYIILIPVTKGIKKADISILRELIGSQPIIGKIADKVFKVMEALVSLKR